MVDPDVGDYSTAVFSATRTPGVGERGGLPGAQARLGLTTKVDDRNFDIGLSATYARGKNVGTVGTTNFQNGVDSWGVALDYSLPILNKFNLTGEAYVGRALGIFSVDSGESVLPFGTVGARGVNSRGGWMQAQFNLNPIWQINLAYGIDAPDFSQLPPGNRTKNQSYVGNVMYKFSPNVTFAWEYRRVLTNFRDRPAANNKDDIVNLALHTQRLPFLVRRDSNEGDARGTGASEYAVHSQILLQNWHRRRCGLRPRLRPEARIRPIGRIENRADHGNAINVSVLLGELRRDHPHDRR